MDLDEIQLLIIEEIAGTITPADRELLYNILSENEEAFARWQEMQQVLTPAKVAAIAAGMQAGRPDEIIRTAKRRKRTIQLAKVFSAAAAIILLLGASWFVYFSIQPKQHALHASDHPAKHIELQLSDGKSIDLSTAGQQIQAGHLLLHNNNKRLSYIPDERSPQLITLRIPAGKDYTIVLSDSTEVMLNAASSLQFPSFFTGNTREVTINGEAYFQIAAKADQPFIVHLPGNTVNVLGTAFNINTYDAGLVKVALVEGAVKIATGKQDVLLKPGYEITSTRSGISKEAFDADKVLGWRTGVYTFENASLRELAPVILRWFGVTIALDNQRVSGRRFFGIIDRNQPLQAFLHNLERADGIKSRYDEQGVLHFE